MSIIRREPAAAARERFDAIIIGGGIHGVMLSLEASRRGLRSLLLEKNDFGGATSFNSLRIIHGGLRYLQSFDLHRFRESVGERRWLLKVFPQHVVPLPCLMPLYGNGLHRPFVLRAALLANDFLSRKRNDGALPNRQLPDGRVIDARIVQEIFPSVDRRNLQGGAIWYDAFMPASQRLLIDVLRWACTHGAVALNYVEAHRLLKAGGRTAGVAAIDRESGESLEYEAGIVINAAGPWCRHLAAVFDRDEERLFKSSIAWNVLLKRETLSDHAVAVTPKRPGGRVYFLVPWRGSVLAGTGHAPWAGGMGNGHPRPTGEQLQEFLTDLNLAVPGLGVGERDISHIFAGLLPATRAGTAELAAREIIHDHGRTGGPQGFYSISGIKFTTARLVAQKALCRAFPLTRAVREVAAGGAPRPAGGNSSDGTGTMDLEHLLDAHGKEWMETLGALIEEESILHLDDLVFRRTNLWANPERAMELAPLICRMLHWDTPRSTMEVEKLSRLFRNSITSIHTPLRVPYEIPL